MLTSIPVAIAPYIALLSFISITFTVRHLINTTQPTPYIDEIFHIPQAQRFCSTLSNRPISSVSWREWRNVGYDDKLTTPPGLYMISVWLSKVLPGSNCGDVEWLRSTSLTFLVLLTVMITTLLRQKQDFRKPQELKALFKGHLEARVQKREDKQKGVSRGEIKALQAKAKAEQPPTPDNSNDDISFPAPESIDTRTKPQLASTTTSPNLSLDIVDARRRQSNTYFMAVACTISFLPPLWFFGFLYYTDLASVWLIVVCLVLFSSLNTATSARSRSVDFVLITMASVLAVLVRQTNIVWVLFAAAQAILAKVMGKIDGAEKGLVWEVQTVLNAALGVGGEEGQKARGKFWRVIALNLAPLVPMLSGCAWFIQWNGSIVLGDKANHQAGLHFPQIGYFLAFTTAFGFFHLIHALQPPSTVVTSSPVSLSRQLFTSARTAGKNLLTLAFGSTLRIASFGLVSSLFYKAVQHNTIEHPFLLADNRHYTFYLWRLFRRSYTLPFLPSVAIQPRYATVPLYTTAFFAWSIALTCTTRRGVLFSVLFWGATAATLVPTPLIEPRYYIIPYVILRIYTQPIEENAAAASDQQEGQARKNKRRQKWLFLALELATYAVTNAVTVALFVGRPFEWAPNAVDTERNEGTTMRFIW